MAKAKTKPAELKVPGTSVPASFATGEVSTSTETPTPTVKHNPPIEGDASLIAKAKAAQAERDAAAKKAKDDAKAEKKAAADKIKADKAEARAKSKTEREERLAKLAAEGKAYTGSMLALADRVKQGVYVVGATGQLRSNDELAQTFDGISPTDVIRIGLDILGITDNPYANLNVGQQSMNLRNRMRGAIKKETITLAGIKDYIERNGIVVTAAIDQATKAKAKADKKAEADRIKAEKEAAKTLAAKSAVEAVEAVEEAQAA